MEWFREQFTSEIIVLTPKYRGTGTESVHFGVPFSGVDPRVAALTGKCFSILFSDDKPRWVGVYRGQIVRFFRTGNHTQCLSHFLISEDKHQQSTFFGSFCRILTHIDPYSLEKFDAKNQETRIVASVTIKGPDVNFFRRHAAHKLFLNRGSASASVTPCSSQYLAQVIYDTKNMKWWVYVTVSITVIDCYLYLSVFICIYVYQCLDLCSKCTVFEKHNLLAYSQKSAVFKQIHMPITMLL